MVLQFRIMDAAPLKDVEFDIGDYVNGKIYWPNMQIK